MEGYFLAMKQINAEERLSNIHDVSFPHYKKDQAKKVEKDLFKLAYPENFKSRGVSIDQINSVLNRGFKWPK